MLFYSSIVFYSVSIVVHSCIVRYHTLTSIGNDTVYMIHWSLSYKDTVKMGHPFIMGTFVGMHCGISCFRLPYNSAFWSKLLFAVRYIDKIWHMFITFGALISVKVLISSHKYF